MMLPIINLNDYMQSTLYKPLDLRKIDENLLLFWLPYIEQSLVFDIPLSETMTFKIEPYYGSILHEYDMIGQPYFIGLDFGGSELVTVSIPTSLLTIILGNYLDPLLPEHFDETFVCHILEMIFVDILTEIKEKTGIAVHFHAFSGSKGSLKSQWRLYVNDNTISYPILIGGEQSVIEDLLKRLFISANNKPKMQPLVELKIFSFMRKISVTRLRNLKLGEIIVLMTKRHPINEPLVIIGNKIVLHTVLKGMELHLVCDPLMIHDVEELNMTIYDDDIDALTDFQEQDVNQNTDNELNLALSEYKITVTFELNRLEIPAHIVSQMTQGSVINLQKQITEDIFLTVSGRTIAIGEVVQIGRNFGVLIKEVF